MIKIQEHLNRSDADEFLDGLALRLWDFFNKELADQSDYQHYSLIKRLDRLITLSDESDYLSDIANNDNHRLQRQKGFLEYLKNNNYEKLKALVISRPEDLLSLRNEILNILNVDDIFINESGIKQTPFGKLLVDQIFIYKIYRSSAICTDLINEMNLQNSFCPYCNYTRVDVVEILDEQSTTVLDRAYLDIDHFFPKSQNPFFALSFYNLIPSCHNCNSTEKLDKEFSIETHTNPFHKSYNISHKFVIDSNFTLKGRTDDLSINNIAPYDDFMDRDLHLTERYKHIYIDKINILINHYMNYQHYRESQEYSFDYSDALLQNVPNEEYEILLHEGGKMYRDILKTIDVFGLIE